ncbi:MAG: 4-hydroxybenzoate octaprenyltransferase [Pacificimonas sp.]|jgi:4-hydroxybenzoate polyprenyltransferase|nr:4-hydroxybenzoate octaprenyltransferase [Pacificimonas sp.]
MEAAGDRNERTQDAAPSWVDRLPGALRPYARLARADRPIGTWLLFWPCLWGLFLAAPEPTEALIYAALFLVGSFAMRSAGCVWNDIVDRDLDARVERTRSRPIASGRVSRAQAAAFMGFLCLIGLAVLLALPAPAQIVALASILLVAGYPFMKRITWWPQAWLGLTFNWGVLVGYASAAETLTPAALLLYAAGVFWTLGYDTIYALQDIEDDALAGIRSSARRLGSRVRRGVAIFYTLTALLAASALAAIALLAAIAALPFAAHLAWQVARLEPADPANPLRLFRSNAAAGALLAASIGTAAALGWL